MHPEAWSQIYLGSFLVGFLATSAMLLLGIGHHGGHGHGGHGNAHGGGHAHGGHGHGGGHAHAHGGHAHGGGDAHGGGHAHAHGAHAHGGQAHGGGTQAHAGTGDGGDAEPLVGRAWLGAFSSVLLPLLNVPSLLALLTAGGAAGWIALRLGASLGASRVAAAGAGLAGAEMMAWAMRLLVRAEAGVVAPLDEVGTLAKVIAPIAPGRVGEIVLARDGKRQALPARGDDETVAAERDVEVVILRVEHGVAYVRRAADLFDMGERR